MKHVLLSVPSKTVVLGICVQLKCFIHQHATGSLDSSDSFWYQLLLCFIQYFFFSKHPRHVWLAQMKDSLIEDGPKRSVSAFVAQLSGFNLIGTVTFLCVQVVAHLQAKNEEYTVQSTALAKSNEELSGHNRLLSVNLESSARVIEKLIDLNEEAMNRFNHMSAAAEARDKYKRAQQADGVAFDPDGDRKMASHPRPGVSESFSTPEQVEILCPEAKYVATEPKAVGLGDALALFLEDDLAGPVTAASLANPLGSSSLDRISARQPGHQTLFSWFSRPQHKNEKEDDNSSHPLSIPGDALSDIYRQSDDRAASNV